MEQEQDSPKFRGWLDGRIPRNTKAPVMVEDQDNNLGLPKTNPLVQDMIAKFRNDLNLLLAYINDLEQELAYAKEDLAEERLLRAEPARPMYVVRASPYQPQGLPKTKRARPSR